MLEQLVLLTLSVDGHFLPIVYTIMAQICQLNFFAFHFTVACGVLRHGCFSLGLEYLTVSPVSGGGGRAELVVTSSISA